MAGYAVLALAYVMSQFFRAFLAVLTPVLTAELGIEDVALEPRRGIPHPVGPLVPPDLAHQVRLGVDAADDIRLGRHLAIEG